MKHEFWHQRWAENRIGFHQLDSHRLLNQCWKLLNPKRDESVLIPLCGKSLDINWLAAKHANVVGVELSDIAVRSFFSENFYTPQVFKLPSGHSQYEFDEITLISGDFFTAPLETFPLIYDRAALIALPRDMRVQYADRLKSLLRKGGRLLLITLEHGDEEKVNPPFQISENEVRDLFAPLTVSLLADYAEVGKNGREEKEFAWLIET